MTKLSALTTFLLNLNLFAAEQLESFVDDLTIRPACRSSAVAGQIVVCEMDYTAALYIERFPHDQVPAPVLFAQISAWLLQNDSDRAGGYTFPVVVDVLDAATADIEMHISFTEYATATTNPSGALVFNGQRYAIDA